MKDLYWLAGLLEGEGYFQLSGTGRSLLVGVAMTDLDAIEKTQRLIEGAPIRGYLLKSRKTFWRTQVYGAKAAGLMMTLYLLMGVRRRAKIRELLSWWKPRPVPLGYQSRVWGKRRDP